LNQKKRCRGLFFVPVMAVIGEKWRLPFFFLKISDARGLPSGGALVIGGGDV
jgi:hypothetical protein